MAETFTTAVADEDTIRLGKIVELGGMIEFHLTRLFSAMSGCNAMTALHSFFAITSAKTKRDIIVNLAYNGFIACETPNEGEYRNFQNLMDEYKKVSEIRNRIVHGIWTISSVDGLPLRTYFSGSAEHFDHLTRGERTDPKTQSILAKNTFTRNELEQHTARSSDFEKGLIEFIEKRFPGLWAPPKK